MIPALSAHRVAILANPAAGRHDPVALDRIATSLRTAGRVVKIMLSRAPGDLAARVAALDVDVIAVAGGDGTVDEVVGGLLRHRSSPRSRLAVIPQGTADVLALEYTLPREASAIAAAILAARIRPLHLGVVESEDGATAPHPFFLMASAGFDAEVVHAVEAGGRRRFKKLAFAGAALRLALRGGSDVHVEATSCTGEGLAFDSALAIVTKSAHYGGPFRLTAATGSDRAGLRLVALRRGGPLALLAAGLRLALGRLERSPNVVACDVARVRLSGRTPDREIHIQIDGEPAGMTPVTIRPLDEQLDLIVG